MIRDISTLRRFDPRFVILMEMRGFLGTEATQLRNWLRVVPIWKWHIFSVSTHSLYELTMVVYRNYAYDLIMNCY